LHEDDRTASDAGGAVQFGGRFAFLDALSLVGSDMLDDLRRRVLAPHLTVWERGRVQQLRLTALQAVAEADETVKSALAALYDWCSRHSIVDPWLIEASDC
jgi:hypothetical protein